MISSGGSRNPNPQTVSSACGAHEGDAAPSDYSDLTVDHVNPNIARYASPLRIRVSGCMLIISLL